MSDAVRGLLWLPLLAVFVGLARAGWVEYQNVEAYRRWAEPLDRAKYDVRSLLGQAGATVIWAKPARPEPTEIDRFELSQVQAIALLADGRPVATDNPSRGRAEIEFDLGDRQLRVPFTDLNLAARWTDALRRDWDATRG